MKVGYIRDSDLNYEALVFSDESSAESLEIQRALDFDEQDAANGMDTYCLSTSAGASVYGGVDGWRITDAGVQIRLSGDAADVLGLPVALDLWVDGGDIGLVKENLQGILEMQADPEPAGPDLTV